MGLHDVASQGYCFQTDLTWRAVRSGLRVVEVPITFVEREVGDSKMSRAVMTESLRRITGWGVGHRAAQVRATSWAGRASRGGTHCEQAGRDTVRRPRSTAPRAVRWVFLALIIPIVEIAAIIAVGRVIGGWPTLALLVLESMLGRGSSSVRAHAPGQPFRRP